MPRHPAPLPDGLLPAFRVRDAPVTRRRTRCPDLDIPTRGTRVPTGCDDLPARCRAFALVLPPDAAYSHSTAAELQRMPLPWRSDGRLHAILPSGARIRRNGLVAHRHTLSQRDVVVIDGIRVTSPARTFCDLGELLDATALTVVADHLVRRAPSAALEEVLSRYRARRGRVAVRAAIERADGRSESPKETELRVLLLEAGFGPFEVNHEIVDAIAGFVARVDLGLPVHRVAVEYEGDHHRDRAQWRRDIARRRRIEASGWTYIPVTQADLADPTALFRDLRRALFPR